MPFAPEPARMPRVGRTRGPHHAVYSSAAWRRFRAWYLARNPVCVFCQAGGRLRASREIHHVRRLADGGDVFDLSNCRALCTPCHSAETFAGR